MSVFKYKFAVSQQSQLKSSLQKKLLQSLKRQYPYVDDATWKQIFPSKCAVLMSKLSKSTILLYSVKLKSQAPSAAIIYFFQMKVYGKDCIYPSLFLLWKLPNFLPCICIHSPVSKFILRGADLMLPGVSQKVHRYYRSNQPLNTVFAADLSVIRKDDVFSIKVIGNPLPCAVGYSILNSSEITGAGSKGRFMKMMHIFRDQLWEFGGKRKPNAGFLSTVINPIESTAVAAAAADTTASGVEEKDSRANDGGDDSNGVTFDTKFAALSMDEKLSYGFMRTLLAVSPSALPVVVSDIYQSMQQNKERPPFKNIDVKQSSFNKLARFATAPQFASLMVTKKQKSKLMVQSLNSKEIAKYLVLLLNRIEAAQFEAIIQWFHDHEHAEPDSQPNDDDTESQERSENVEPAASLEQQFKSWHDAEFKTDDEDDGHSRSGAGMDAQSVIECLFGGWPSITESESVDRLFLKQCSEKFNVILPEDDDADNGSSKDVESTVNRSNADDVWRLQFLETLRRSVDPEQLPLSVSSFLTRKNMYILKPDFVFSKRNLLNVDLDQDIITSVKQTRWKKSGKFLKMMSKQNIIQLKDCGNTGGELMITRINWEFLANQFNAGGKFEFFSPAAFAKFSAKVLELQGKELRSRNGGRGGSESKESVPDQVEEAKFMASKQQIRIKTLYRANHRLLPIFGDGSISELHTKNKARTFLWSYVQSKKLVKAQSRGEITIDQPLFHMLYDSKMIHNKMAKKDGFKNKKEKEQIAKVRVNSTVHRRDLVNLFDLYLDAYTAIILDEDEEPKYKSGFPPKITVTADKRQGRKFMTHVTGLENYGIDCQQFAAEAKRFFSAAVTISDLSGKKAMMKGGNVKRKVSIQGNKVKTMDSKDVPALLNSHYGIPSQYIHADSTVTKHNTKK